MPCTLAALSGTIETCKAKMVEPTHVTLKGTLYCGGTFKLIVKEIAATAAVKAFNSDGACKNHRNSKH